MAEKMDVEALVDQASRMMAAGWRGNPNMSGDDRDFMTPSHRRRHDERVRDVVEFVLSNHTGQMVPGSTGSAEGWVLVPREPTEAMVAAAIGPDDGALFGSRKLAADVMRARYRAMIDAAGGRDEG